jgi:hypothetical protein
MDKDRREAQQWAEEWKIKQKNRRTLRIILVLLLIAAIGVGLHFVGVLVSRTTYASADEMKAALQGRYETDYAEDIVIDGDKVTLTYYNPSHYSLEYAEEYGYSDYEDSVYEDTVVEWDYRDGEIKCGWMDKIWVNKEGNLVYYDQEFKKTSDPKPTPLDPSELSLFKQGYDSAQSEDETLTDDGSDAAAAAEGEEAASGEETEGMEAAQESQLETQAAADSAGVEAN